MMILGIVKGSLKLGYLSLYDTNYIFVKDWSNGFSISDVVIFDNSYSWTKGKTVAFFIEVHEPTSVDEVMINKENSITRL